MPTAELLDRRRESRLRGKANRRGYRLVKSRCRNPQAFEHGGFLVLDASTHGAVASAWPAFSMSLEDVEAYLQNT